MTHALVSRQWKLTGNLTSANDVTVAIAEHIAKDVDTFIKRMNQRAQELGMTDTEFHSVHGLPPGRGQHFDRSTARDLLKLALELLNHPEYLDWASVRLDSFRNGTFQLLNTNHRLMRNYKGMDGMKTGYHRKGGFSLVATAKRNERRFVSIVMGVKSSRLRSKLTRMLLDEGFQKYKQVSLDVQLGMSPLSIEVDKGSSLVSVNFSISFVISFDSSVGISPVSCLMAETSES